MVRLDGLVERNEKRGALLHLVDAGPDTPITLKWCEGRRARRDGLEKGSETGIHRGRSITRDPHDSAGFANPDPDGTRLAVTRSKRAMGNWWETSARLSWPMLALVGPCCGRWASSRRGQGRPDERRGIVGHLVMSARVARARAPGGDERVRARGWSAGAWCIITLARSRGPFLALGPRVR